MSESAKRPPGRPASESGTPPAYAFRIPRELHAEARRIADARGESLPEVVRQALESYVARYHREVPWQEKEKP